MLHGSKYFLLAADLFYATLHPAKELIIPFAKISWKILYFNVEI